MEKKYAFIDIAKGETMFKKAFMIAFGVVCGIAVANLLFVLLAALLVAVFS